ncbi:hypothetical protein BDW75DRAFT_86741 [Aspergillus navahoensis]
MREAACPVGILMRSYFPVTEAARTKPRRPRNLGNDHYCSSGFPVRDAVGFRVSAVDDQCTGHSQRWRSSLRPVKCYEEYGPAREGNFLLRVISMSMEKRGLCRPRPFLETSFPFPAVDIEARVDKSSRTPCAAVIVTSLRLSRRQAIESQDAERGRPR